MAGKKFTPLKDEPFDSNAELLEEVRNLKLSIDSWDRKFEEMSPSSSFEQELRIEIGKIIRDKLSAALEKQLKDREMVTCNGKLTPIDELINTFIDKHEEAWKLATASCGVVGSYSKLVNSITAINNNIMATHRNIKVLDGKMDCVNMFLVDILGLQINKPKMPKRPATFRQWPHYIFCDLPLYWYSRALPIVCSKYVRTVVRVSLVNFIVILFGLICFIAHDNAQLRETKEKYQMLRYFSNSNPEWKEAADYVEVVFADKKNRTKEQGK